MTSIARFPFAVVLTKLTAAPPKGGHVFEGVAASDARRDAGRADRRRRRRGKRRRRSRRYLPHAWRCGAVADGDGGSRKRTRWRENGEAERRGRWRQVDMWRKSDVAAGRFVGGEEGAEVTTPDRFRVAGVFLVGSSVAKEGSQPGSVDTRFVGIVFPAGKWGLVR